MQRMTIRRISKQPIATRDTRVGFPETTRGHGETHTLRLGRGLTRRESSDDRKHPSTSQIERARVRIA